MIKLRMVFLVLAVSMVFSAIAMGAEKGKASKGKHAKKADKQQVVYMDLSGDPEVPGDDFPKITDKGKL